MSSAYATEADGTGEALAPPPQTAFMAIFNQGGHLQIKKRLLFPIGCRDQGFQSLKS